MFRIAFEIMIFKSHLEFFTFVQFRCSESFNLIPVTASCIVLGIIDFLWLKISESLPTL